MRSNGVEGVEMIEVRGLEIAGGPGTASFTVAAGELVAICARNGATPLLEIISGYRKAEVGLVRVDGHDPYTERGDVTVGALWAEGGLFGELTLNEIVDAWRAWTSEPLARDTVVALAGLEPRAAVPFCRLTPGERRRFDLALAMIGKPSVLVIDEPTAGLDPEGSHEVWNLIRSLSVTVVVATRSPYEARNADRVLTLDAGRIVSDSGAVSRAA
jgi:ABC-2 type transport system ATP-binding protein